MHRSSRWSDRNERLTRGCRNRLGSAGTCDGTALCRARRHRWRRRTGLTALPPPRRSRTVLESSSNRPRRIRPGAPPAALAPGKARRHRRCRRTGLTALPPPRRSRIVLESSSNRPRTVPEGSGQLPGRIRPASRKDLARVPHRSHRAHAGRRTSVWPPPGLPTPATSDLPLRGRIPGANVRFNPRLEPIRGNLGLGPHPPRRKADLNGRVAGCGERAQAAKRKSAGARPQTQQPDLVGFGPLTPAFPVRSHRLGADPNGTGFRARGTHCQRGTGLPPREPSGPPVRS